MNSRHIIIATCGAILTVSTILFLVHPALELMAQTRQKTSGVPTLKEIKTFLVYAKEGNYKAFDISTGKLIENKEANDFRNGEIQYTITGPNSAIISANQGSAEVELVKDDRSVTFIETTIFGNKMIMIISDKWDTKEKGFLFTYIRNVKMPPFDPSGKLLRSIYSGIAKPAGE